MEAYFLSSSYLAHAASSVSAMIGVKVAKNLIDCGSRFFSAARLRMLAIFLRRRAGEWLDTKTASAWVAAKFEPAGEVPAWKRKGVRWGEGSTMWRVLRLKYLP